MKLTVFLAATLAICLGTQGGTATETNRMETTNAAPRLKITISEPWTATSQPAVPWDDKTRPRRCWLPHLIQGRNGELVLQHYAWPDCMEFPPEPPFPGLGFRSDDLGKTWNALGELPGGGSTLGGALPDGTILQMVFVNFPAKTEGVWNGRIRRSTDGGRTWQLTNAPIRVAQARPAGKYGDGVYLDGTLLILKDGSLLASGYGYFKGEQKFRAYLIRSADNGASWDYYSTIAYDPKVGAESFCEPALVRLKDGRLLAMLRIGSNLPMRQCYSSDEGRTWTAPKDTGAPSVEPDLLLMSNGVLVCSFGRPGAWIMFSADGAGEKWTDRTLVDNCHSWFYTSLVEIKPGVLLYAYDQQNLKDPATGQLVNAIRLRTIAVER
jgi:hypothetical protein